MLSIFIIPFTSLSGFLFWLLSDLHAPINVGQEAEKLFKNEPKLVLRWPAIKDLAEA